MKRGRWLASAAIACWALLPGATQASEYIRGLGATGDPRVMTPGTPATERLRIADRCLDCLEAWRKEIRPEYDKLRISNFSVSFGDAATEDERAQLEEEKRISYWNSLLRGRQEELRRAIQFNVMELAQLLRETGKQNPDLLEVIAAKTERAEALKAGLRERPAPK